VRTIIYNYIKLIRYFSYSIYSIRIVCVSDNYFYSRVIKLCVFAGFVNVATNKNLAATKIFRVYIQIAAILDANT